MQDEGDADDLLDTEYEDDAVEDQFENDFGDMPGTAQVCGILKFPLWWFTCL